MAGTNDARPDPPGDFKRIPPPPTPLEKSEKTIAEMADNLSTMAKNLTEFEGAAIAIQRVIAAMEEIQTLRTKLLRKHTGDQNGKNEPGEDVL